MSKKVMIAVIIALLIAIAGGVGYLVMEKKAEKQHKEEMSKIQDGFIKQLNNEAINETEAAPKIKK